MGYDLIMPFPYPYEPVHSLPTSSQEPTPELHPSPSLVRYRVIMIVPSRLHCRRIAERRASSPPVAAYISVSGPTAEYRLLVAQEPSTERVSVI
jgi:hypothetical protein